MATSVFEMVEAESKLLTSRLLDYLEVNKWTKQFRSKFSTAHYVPHSVCFALRRWIYRTCGTLRNDVVSMPPPFGVAPSFNLGAAIHICFRLKTQLYVTPE